MFLVNVHSALFRSLSCRLSPLESPRYLHVSHTEFPKSRIKVELPRMNLSFFINEEGQIESSNFRGQIVDMNQSVGTMFGLRNQLVLCSKDLTTRSLPRSRSVLIPHGNILFAKKDIHVSVTIQAGSARKALFSRYLVDTDLGYLVTEADLTSRLLKIYLHALTSHCLPDPLTKRTGTEEALYQLSEPSSSSFENLNELQAQLLRLIGRLTPKREFYPPHLKCMQTTSWAKLPSLSQHFAFFTATASILRRAENLQLFSGKVVREGYTTALEDFLLKRATRRTGIYYPPDQTDFVQHILGCSALVDPIYNGRTGMTATWEEMGQAAGWASSIVFQNWGRPFHQPCDLVALMESLGTIEGPSETLDLTYSSDWLKIQLPAHWFNIYNLCRTSKTLGNKYALSACLATAAFSQKLPLSLVATFVALATNTVFQHLPPPRFPLFELKDGYQPNIGRVQELISSAVRAIGEIPTSAMGRGSNPFNGEFGERQCAFYVQQIKKHTADFAQSLTSQWPSIRLQVRSPEFWAWFKVEECLPEVRDYFTSCSRNVELRKHLREIEQALGCQPASNIRNVSPVMVCSVPHLGTSIAPNDPLGMLCLRSLMCTRACTQFTERQIQSEISLSKNSGSAVDTSRLLSLFNEFKLDPRPLNRRYGDELDESRTNLDDKPPITLLTDLPALEHLVKNSTQHHSELKARFQHLRFILAPSNVMDRLVHIAGIWPRITPRTILHQLSFRARLRFADSCGWHDELVGYARAFTAYQRAQRLVALAQSGSKQEFYKEVDCTFDESNEGACNPDWLLVQVSDSYEKMFYINSLCQD